MNYRQPRRMPAEEAAGIFQSGPASDIAEALISASLYVPDREWVEGWVVHFASSSETDIRRAAALALGSLARLHRQVSPEAVAAIRGLLGDTELSGAAEDALEDVEIFTKLV